MRRVKQRGRVSRLVGRMWWPGRLCYLVLNAIHVSKHRRSLRAKSILVIRACLWLIALAGAAYSLRVGNGMQGIYVCLACIGVFWLERENRDSDCLDWMIETVPPDKLGELMALIEDGGDDFVASALLRVPCESVLGADKQMLRQLLSHSDREVRMAAIGAVGRAREVKRNGLGVCI